MPVGLCDLGGLRDLWGLYGPVGGCVGDSHPTLMGPHLLIRQQNFPAPAGGDGAASPGGLSSGHRHLWGQRRGHRRPTALILPVLSYIYFHLF